MIDTQRLHFVARNPLEDAAVRVRENGGPFHPERSEAVDIEETPVVDVVGRHAPERETVELRLDERMQSIEARWVARYTVQLAYLRFDKAQDSRLLFAERGETTFERFALLCGIDDRFTVSAQRAEALG